MQIKFEGQSAIVTGAAHGFGRAVAQRLAELGARVWATDILERELSETARLAGENCRPHRLDVTDRDAVQALAKSVDSRPAASTFWCTARAASWVRSASPWMRSHRRSGKRF